MAYHQVARVFREGTLTGMSDRQILERYADRREEAAFEAIVARHGPMVLNVCRQLLRDSHDVDDAFQATFLALIRKAGSIRVEESLGPWLHTVANRIAMRARANSLQRAVREPTQDPLPEQSAASRPDCPETSRLIHEELSRLPERLRVPVVLCYLQGITHEMAANRLGCPIGTIHSRLARARAILHRRLVRRGLTLSAGALAALLESTSKAVAGTVPLHLRMSLIRVATRSVSEVAVGSSAGGAGVSASAVALVEGVLNVMRIKTLTIAAAGLASVGILLAVVGTTAYSVAGTPDEQPTATAKPELRPDPSPEKEDPRESRSVTYAVGDLIASPHLPMTKQPPGMVQPPGTLPEIPPKPTFDMMRPLINLVATTIEPGSWKIFDGQGHLRQGTSELVGSITPFHLSDSLNIRGTKETHKKVAILFRGLRGLDFTRNNPGKHLEAIEEAEEHLGIVLPEASRSTGRRDLQVSPTSAKNSPGPKGSGSRAKIDQLLDQLRQEIGKLPNGQTD